jgi:hypothetical protein
MNRQVAVENQEELVLLLVMVPDKFAFELGKFDVLAIEFANDMGTPVFSELLEFLDKVHLVVLAVIHVRLPSRLGQAGHGGLEALPGFPNESERVQVGVPQFETHLHRLSGKCREITATGPRHVTINGVAKQHRAIRQPETIDRGSFLILELNSQRTSRRCREIDLQRRSLENEGLCLQLTTFPARQASASWVHTRMSWSTLPCTSVRRKSRPP